MRSCVRPELCTRVSLVSLLAALTSCATIKHGTQQVVPITSNPPGARVSIDSIPVGVTPLKVTLPRGRPHLVSIARDSGAPADVLLTKHRSGWVYANIFWLYGLPVLLDLSNGAAYNLRPTTVRVAFPDSLASPMAVAWGIARGQRIRLIAPENPAVLVEAIVDSFTTDRLFWRHAGPHQLLDAVSASTPIAELRRLQVHQPPNFGAGGVAGMHYLSQVTTIAVLGGLLALGLSEGTFILGGLATLTAIPVGFFGGAALAPARWSPLETFRTGSPLLANDRLRVQLHDSNALIRGRLVDIEASDLLIAVRADTMRVPRSAVRRMQRADGFRLGRGVLNGAIAGAAIGLLSLALSDSRSSQEEILIAPLAGAYIGLFVGPALAPRRWREVLKW